MQERINDENTESDDDYHNNGKGGASAAFIQIMLVQRELSTFVLEGYPVRF
jgi:hypothetical protein